jgi:hypothetical protein
LTIISSSVLIDWEIVGRYFSLRIGGIRFGFDTEQVFISALNANDNWQDILRFEKPQINPHH